ncbi:MAG: leucyl/phenylalanyl-tRNA--protein transferase [Phycisphaeraceae bacterium]
MANRSPLDIPTLIEGYAAGCFPMADSRHGEVAWYRPRERAILPLDGFHVPRRLAKLIRSGRYRVSVNEAFDDVIDCCAAPRRTTATSDDPDDAGETWINREIQQAYGELHREGFAVSIEAWLAADAAKGPQAVPAGPSGPIEPVRCGDEVLAGGVYAVTLGRAVFAESMFSRYRDASKVCLVRLVELCRSAGVTLLDIQMDSEHLRRFGAEPIGHTAFMVKLEEALGLSA